jgi:hypothetical protein
VNFIRGRSQNVLDSMLPLFAQAVVDTCPIPETALTAGLVEPLTRFFSNAEEKTLKNYSTEIISKLFGMVVHREDGLCIASPLTLKLLEDADQPAFFKALVSRIQYPNPMNRSRTDYEKTVSDGVKIRPLVLVLEVLQALGGPASYLELRTFVLANLVALSGRLSALELAQQIKMAREHNLRLPDPSEPNKPFHHQHIREMLGMLKLANLIRDDAGDSFELNQGESVALKWILKTRSDSGMFRELTASEEYAGYQKDWSAWYGALPDIGDQSLLDTPLAALHISDEALSPNLLPHGKGSTQEVGRLGELIVLGWQADMVSMARPQDLKHVKDRSAERGIGFDVQSVWLDGEKAGQFRFIEVKTTKRSTRPVASSSQPDLVNLTSNEYRAARTHGANFTIARVYLFSGGYEVFCVDDPVSLHNLGDVILEPADWNLYLTAKVFTFPSLMG